MEPEKITIIMTAVGGLASGLFGKAGWGYLTRRKEIDAGTECEKRIELIKKEWDSRINELNKKHQEDYGSLKRELGYEITRNNNVRSGFEMLFIMLKDEFKDRPSVEAAIVKLQQFIGNAKE